MKNNTQLTATAALVLRALCDGGHVGVGGSSLPALTHGLIFGPCPLNASDIVDALRDLSDAGLATSCDAGWGPLWQATAAGGRAVGHRRW